MSQLPRRHGMPGPTSCSRTSGSPGGGTLEDTTQARRRRAGEDTKVFVASAIRLQCRRPASGAAAPRARWRTPTRTCTRRGRRWTSRLWWTRRGWPRAGPAARGRRWPPRRRSTPATRSHALSGCGAPARTAATLRTMPGVGIPRRRPDALGAARMDAAADSPISLAALGPSATVRIRPDGRPSSAVRHPRPTRREPMTHSERCSCSSPCRGAGLMAPPARRGPRSGRHADIGRPPIQSRWTRISRHRPGGGGTSTCWKGS